jgi:hypothetical protein
MNNDDEYHRQAAEAEKQAHSAKFASDRESWLRIAQGWLSLLRKRPQSDEEAFNAQSKAKGTGQDDSDPRIKAASVGGLFHFFLRLAMGTGPTGISPTAIPAQSVIQVLIDDAVPRWSESAACASGTNLAFTWFERNDLYRETPRCGSS